MPYDKYEVQERPPVVVTLGKGSLTASQARGRRNTSRSVAVPGLQARTCVGLAGLERYIQEALDCVAVSVFVIDLHLPFVRADT